jgi:hypothetical protein
VITYLHGTRLAGYWFRHVLSWCSGARAMLNHWALRPTPCSLIKLPMSSCILDFVWIIMYSPMIKLYGYADC